MAKLTEKQLQQPVSVKFPVEVRIELEEAVQRSGLNRNQFISQSVAYFLRNVDPSNSEIQRRSPETSSEGSTTGGVDEQARKALTALLGRTQGLEEHVKELQSNDQELRGRIDTLVKVIDAQKEITDQVMEFAKTIPELSKIAESMVASYDDVEVKTEKQFDHEKFHDAMKKAENSNDFAGQFEA